MSRRSVARTVGAVAYTIGGALLLAFLLTRTSVAQLGDVLRAADPRILALTAASGLAVTVSMVLWVFMAATATLAQLAFSSPLGPARCAAAAVLTQAASLLPIHAPLGIGTDDAVWTVVLASLGLPIGNAIALALSVRIALLGTVAVDSLSGGIVLLVSFIRGNR